MRVVYHILARWYEARSIRARRNADRLRSKAEEFFRKVSEVLK